MPSKLSPAAQEAMTRAILVSGYPIVVVSDSHLDVWSTIRIPRPGEQFCVLAYNPSKRAYLDYLISHECAHLYRLYSASPTDRQVPISSPTGMKRAKDEIRREHWKGRREVPKGKLEALLQYLCTGLVRQLVNTPVDYRIETWIHGEFADLRDMQAAALREQYSDARKCLLAKIKEYTPSSIHKKSSAMNYVLAKLDSEILGDSSLVDEYFEQGSAALGEKLYSHLGRMDEGHTGDIRTTNLWAKDLEITDWFQWQDLWSR